MSVAEFDKLAATLGELETILIEHRVKAQVHLMRYKTTGAYYYTVFLDRGPSRSLRDDLNEVIPNGVQLEFRSMERL